MPSKSLTLISVFCGLGTPWHGHPASKDTQKKILLLFRQKSLVVFLLWCFLPWNGSHQVFIIICFGSYTETHKQALTQDTSVKELKNLLKSLTICTEILITHLRKRLGGRNHGASLGHRAVTCPRTWRRAGVALNPKIGVILSVLAPAHCLPAASPSAFQTPLEKAFISF